MKCKHCYTRLDENTTVCPVCGQQIKTSKKGNGTMATIVTVVLLVAALFGAVGLSIYLNARRPENAKSYTASDAEVIAAGDRVVATAGQYTLTVRQLQAYYRMEVYGFLDENASDIAYMGLDYNKPLEDQICFMDETKSWQEFFLECALRSWHQFVAVDMEAKKDGFVLDAETQKYLDSLPETMEKAAKEGKFNSADEMLSKELGAGVDLKTYLEYITLVQSGSNYFQGLVNKLEPEMEAIEKYFADNEDYFKQYKITKDSGYLAGVRHILIVPEGGTEGSDGDITYSDDEWEACRQKAQQLLDTYLAGGKIDEEAFANLAKEHSKDPGSAAAGGLYAAFPKGYMVKPFEEWSFAEGRQFGDTGLVKTSYGYHIMFFIQTQAEWYYYSRTGVINEMASYLLKDLQNGVEIEVNYDNILLSQVSFK